MEATYFLKFTKLNAVHRFLSPPPPQPFLISHLQKVMLMWSDQNYTCPIRSKVEYSENCINRRTPAGPTLVSV